MAVGGVPDLSEIASIEENIQAQIEEITVLKSIFEGDDDRLQILDSAKEVQNEDLASQNMLKLYIPVKCADRVHVDVQLPLDDYELPPGATSQETHVEKKTPGVKVARSESGQRVIFSFEVLYLPPVCVHVTLPQTYPSRDPPSFVISCVWLSPHQLTVVCQEFDRLWQEYQGDSDSPGMPILYIWLDWVQENLLRTLGIESQVSVSSHCIDEDIDDCRVVIETADLNSIVTQMIRYNRQEERKVFFKTEQECSICFEQNLGTKFFLLPDCNHHVCQECLASHCQLLVKEGSVLQIRCPMYKCKTFIPPYILKDVLSEEEFLRYESLSLMKGLETMGDVTWCPRCNNAVIREPEQDLNLAHCLACFFTFCTECMDKWHQGEKCQFEVEEDEEEKSREREKEKRREDYEKMRLEQKRQNKRSNNYILKMAKRCPQCKAPIMKTGGCNKVDCSYCGTVMCYICEQKIQGYDHFKNCQTFTFDEDIIDNTDIREPQRLGVQVQVNMPRELELDQITKGREIKERLRNEPELKDRTVRCEACKQTNIKETASNHIRCWNCKISLCYHCKQKLNGAVGKHFSGKNACPQHTAV